MPFSVLIDLVFSLFNLLKGSFVWAIPLFFITFIFSLVQKKLMEKFSLSWFKSALLITYTVLFFAVAFIYLFPYSLALLETTVGPAPAQLQLSFEDQLLIAAIALLKVVFLPLLFTILILPFEFIASFVRETVEKRFKQHYAVNLFIGVFVSTAIGAFILLSNNWIFTGLLYLLYWS